MSDTLADTSSWGEPTTGTDIKAQLWYLAGISTIRKLCDSSTFVASVLNHISVALVLNFDPKRRGVSMRSGNSNTLYKNMKEKKTTKEHIILAKLPGELVCPKCITASSHWKQRDEYLSNMWGKREFLLASCSDNIVGEKKKKKSSSSWLSRASASSASPAPSPLWGALFNQPPLVN